MTLTPLKNDYFIFFLVTFSYAPKIRSRLVIEKIVMPIPPLITKLITELDCTYRLGRVTVGPRIVHLLEL
jgi:hypothetical protein